MVKKFRNHPTCKEAFKHRDEFVYLGTGFGYHMYHKRHKNEYVSTYSWDGYLWHCLDDDYGNISKVLECFGIDDD